METSVVKDDQIVTTVIDSDAKKALDKALTSRDKIMVVLQTWATQRKSNEIYQTADDIVGRTGIQKGVVSTTLWKMANAKEIEFIKDGRFIKGFKLLKMPAPAQIVAAGVEKAKHDEIKPVKKLMTPKILPQLIHVTKYMEQKEAVQKAQEILNTAGIESLIEFETNALAEEAVQILSELVETTRLLGECKLEKEALRRSEA